MCGERTRDLKRLLEEAEELRKLRNTEHPGYLLKRFSFLSVGGAPQHPHSTGIAERCDLSVVALCCLHIL